MKELTVLLFSLGVALCGEVHGHSTCRRSWEKIGCFRESRNATTLWTDRGTDPTHNHTIDWKNYAPYLFELACRCKELAAAKGFLHFGLRYYGICTGFSNLNGSPTLDQDKNCVQEQFRNCSSSSAYECMGKAWFDYVYKIGVDGAWSEWTEHTSCDKTCGGGKQIWKRTCTNPPPSSNGVPCHGPDEEIRSCNMKKCPAVNGGWTEYGQWASCDKSCGGGRQIRKRACSNPPPSNDGAPCVGPDEETRSCSLNKCPVCELVVGDGVGGGESYIGLLADTDACVSACLDRRKTDSEINGVTVDANSGRSCYCEWNMTGSNSNVNWRSCKIA